jgi:hypothetical protein
MIYRQAIMDDAADTDGGEGRHANDPDVGGNDEYGNTGVPAQVVGDVDDIVEAVLFGPVTQTPCKTPSELRKKKKKLKLRLLTHLEDLGRFVHTASQEVSRPE